MHFRAKRALKLYIADDTTLRRAADSLKEMEAFAERPEQIKRLGNHQPHAVQQGTVLNSIPGMQQPWMYVQTGE